MLNLFLHTLQTTEEEEGSATGLSDGTKQHLKIFITWRPSVETELKH